MFVNIIKYCKITLHIGLHFYQGLYKFGVGLHSVEKVIYDAEDYMYQNIKSSFYKQSRAKNLLFSVILHILF